MRFKGITIHTSALRAVSRVNRENETCLISGTAELCGRAVTFLSLRGLEKYGELSEGFDIYFPRETESRFHCLSSCLPSSFSRRANSLCECLKCRRNTRNLELSDSCQLTLSENLQGMTGARKPRTPSLVHLLWQPRLLFVYLYLFLENT